MTIPPLDRESHIGSKAVLECIASEKKPMEKEEFFDMQYESAALGLHDNEVKIEPIDVTITVGDVDG